MWITALIFLFLLKLRFPTGTSISGKITTRYSHHGLLLFRSVERITKKIIKLKSDISFLSCCKSYNVIPKFHHFRLCKLQDTNLYKSRQVILLDKEIKTQQLKLNSPFGNCQNIQQRLENVFFIF